MNAGPYSDKRVQKFVNEEYVPLKSQCYWKERTELMKRFDISWTPTFLIQDSTGKVHRKLVGYIPVDDFLAQLEFGKGIVFFEKERHEEAVKWFQRVIDGHSSSGVTPEAIFFRGVAEFKKTHEVGALRRAYDTLAERYSQSEWERRAEPYSNMPK